MAIIMMNLLVGLAVDDIKEVQDHAELKKLSSQVRALRGKQIIVIFQIG